MEEAFGMKRGGERDTRIVRPNHTLHTQYHRQGP